MHGEEKEWLWDFEGNRLLRRGRWDDDIKLDLTEIG
jgi:hypothetical protein